MRAASLPRSPAAVGAWIAAIRICFGLLMVIRPTWTARPLGVDRDTAHRTAWLPRMLGGRELALGLGTLAALRNDPLRNDPLRNDPLRNDPLRNDQGTPGRGSARGWLLAGALSDATDVVAIRSSRNANTLPRVRGAVVALVSVAAASGGVAAAFGQPRAR